VVALKAKWLAMVVLAFWGNYGHTRAVRNNSPRERERWQIERLEIGGLTEVLLS